MPETGGVAKLVGSARALNADLAWRGIDAEDVEAYLRLAEPLEGVVRRTRRFPRIEEGGPGSDLIQLLWFKHHPARADLKTCLDRLASPLAPIRLAAAEALTSWLAAAETASPDPEILRQTHTALLQRRREETSHLLSFQLDGLVERTETLASRPAPMSDDDDLSLNPYVAGLPIRDGHKFFGRGDLLRQISTALSGGFSSVVLHGARRTGKTSLLYQIDSGALGRHFLPVYVDLQAHAGVSVSTLLGAVVEATEEAILRDGEVSLEGLSMPPVSGDSGFQAFQRFVGRVVERLAPRTLLFLFDEYEILQQTLGASDVARQFQALLERQPGPRIVFAGSQKVEQLKSASMLVLLDLARYVKISFLSREETRELITRPSEGRLDFESGTVERIFELTGGHPFYVQLVCQEIFELKRGRGRVGLPDVERATRQFTLNPSPHTVLTWNTLSLNEQLVGSAIAERLRESDWVEPAEIVELFVREKHPVRLKKAEVGQALAGLKEIDWIQQEENGDRLRYCVEVVRRWVSENRSVWDLLRDFARVANARVAGPLRQLFAWLIDMGAAVLGIPLLGFAFAVAPFGAWCESSARCFGLFLGSVFLLTAIPMIAASATVGALALGLRFLSSGGLPLQRAHILGLTSGLVVRNVLWFALVLVDHGFWRGIGLGALAGLEGTNLFMCWRDPLRQGLFSRLLGFLAVWEGGERDRS